MTATDTLPQAPATIQSSLDFDAVLRTYEAVSRVLPETPAWSYPLLNAEAGVEVVSFAPLSGTLEETYLALEGERR